MCGPCLKLLANGETPICAGESAVAGLGVLLAAGQNPELKAKLGLDENSRVAVVICETAPNPPLYIELVSGLLSYLRCHSSRPAAGPS